MHSKLFCPTKWSAVIWLLTTLSNIYKVTLSLVYSDKKIVLCCSDINFIRSTSAPIIPYGAKLGSCECKRADLAIGHTGTPYGSHGDPIWAGPTCRGVTWGPQGCKGCNTIQLSTTLLWIQSGFGGRPWMTWVVNDELRRAYSLMGHSHMRRIGNRIFWKGFKTFRGAGVPLPTSLGHITNQTVWMFVQNKRKQKRTCVYTSAAEPRQENKRGQLPSQQKQ